MKAATSAEVDFREIPAPERDKVLFETFDALRIGAAAELVCDEDPRPMLHRLQSEREGTFEWSPLEEGPELFRVELSRRASGEEADERSVLDCLGWDHDRLELLKDEFFSLAEAGQWKDADRVFSEFRTGLLRHIRAEEEVLFPCFERVSGLGDGPTSVMRAEHEEIKTLLGRLAGSFGPRPDLARVRSLCETLGALLSGHNEKEEQVVYPLTDRNLPPEQRGALVRRIQAS